MRQRKFRRKLKLSVYDCQMCIFSTEQRLINKGREVSLHSFNKQTSDIFPFERKLFHRVFPIEHDRKVHEFCQYSIVANKIFVAVRKTDRVRCEISVAIILRI